MYKNNQNIEIRGSQMKKVILISLILVLGLAANGLADTLTFNYDYVFSGYTPGGTTPWLTATFEDLTDGVKLSLSASGLTGGEFIKGGANDKGWYFNFNPVKDLSALIFAFDSGTNNADGIVTGIDAFKADGDGYYDILFHWKDNELITGQTAVYLITGIADIEVLDFNFFSTPKKNDETSFLSAAHVQGIGSGSGWVAPTEGNYDDGGGGGGNGVPEPSTIILLGAGLFGLGLFGKRNFKK